MGDHRYRIRNVDLFLRKVGRAALASGLENLLRVEWRIGRRFAPTVSCRSSLGGLATSSAPTPYTAQALALFVECGGLPPLFPSWRVGHPPTYLRTIRKQRGLSLKKVEKAAEVSNAYLSQLERGRRNPPHPDILKKLARVYEVPVNDLLAAAGYLDEGKGNTRQSVEQAFEHVISM